MVSEDIRWQQRFNHFEKAFLLLRDAVAIPVPSVVERAGLIQFFEMAFELAWKVLKDYEEAEGFSVRSPRDAIKQAFEAGMVTEGHDWIDALEDRNLTTHTYNEATAQAVEEKIRHKYFPLLEQLHAEFRARAGR
ncbi:nucleotidyltransferase substrate-binding protein, HI0074 family [Citrifermentans bemidjiense Bem]|uniref:Nucleotidyltransferase substrate-binding protein, HI0074 family n=1 Tax=Citrifermentans bemidjiense (strain ATCC BAA-1014 / DSM 16622 / JCM 12645 / Bem) TaxID=404380 RepID=B5EE41_CITBB|nr:nucleotidyltransferase substrate binding protein [Citrifermentans bemidjiense]ACH37779.1 nucleotidyltransferase substrate-binding protein, HI0074 family [Citrifermentans bemidjiense Bem]